MSGLPLIAYGLATNRTITTMPMLKPYYVTLSIGVVVMAKNTEHANTVAKKEAKKVTRNNWEPENPVLITSIEQLTALDASWDQHSIPYGKGDEPLSVILSSITSAERDIHTIDMFEVLNEQETTCNEGSN